MEQIKHLLTGYGEKITGEEYNIYPRPSLVRDSFFSLNGEWELQVKEEKYNICVPYPPESILSGVLRLTCDKDVLIYKKSFTLNDGFLKGRVILHFGAVDSVSSIYLNGNLLGVHVGGYDHFSFDITDYVLKENTLIVEVCDKLGKRVQPYGKQKYKRGGMWYTPISGIWQSVWLESVPNEYIKSLKIDTGCDFARISFEGIDTGVVSVKLLEGEAKFPIVNGKCKIKIDNPVLWSPENPYLYYFTAECSKDKISSYFALRTLEIKEVDGVKRLCLNGKPYFFNAVLDQGYFSDGIYTPASPKEYENDILAMKNLGFNTLRKHIKVEPDEFYYQCDKLGMIVFQDFVNNGKYSFLRDTALPTVLTKKRPILPVKRTQAQKEAFISSMVSTVNQLYNHPCVCLWTIFNEGWGQFDSDKMYLALRTIDSSRIIDSTSGWFKGKLSDVESEHVYFKEVKIKKAIRPILLSEFGGYSYKIKDHSANLKKTYGYKKFTDGKEFENALVSLYENEIIPNIKNGLCGAVYTQLSDVEDETNGLLTYDRKVCKVSPERMREISKKLVIK